MTWRMPPGEALRGANECCWSCLPRSLAHEVLGSFLSRVNRRKTFLLSLPVFLSPSAKHVLCFYISKPRLHGNFTSAYLNQTLQSDMPRFSDRNLLQMGTKIIAVRVGAEPKHTDFSVHESLIRLSSPFFEAALSREWKESQERIVKLPEGNAHAFRIYVHWLYTSQLCSKLQFNHVSLNDGQWEWANLVKGYLLGDYLQDIDFKDSVMDAMIDWGNEAARECSDAPPHSSIEVYQQTGKTSPLRRIVLDFTTWRIINNFPVSMNDYQFPSDFLTAVVTCLTERIRSGKVVRPGFVDKKYCHYHCHGDRTCYKDKDKASLQEACNEVLDPLRMIL
ncbi:hypothetical protein HBH64_098990 [Parastagonospora nodorum]|nr:hypothetical protein HBI01_110090 [Parastagonospora nodorum]KAH4318511.1 hypothetical protein HBI02_000310 [Parastagonospora nodorum]KAH4327567.1 hypothetical protein HBI00_122160 [Parastagonospora nodorum]KAH4370178.1 hypothetical protein HBH94_122380 [Parastagonospora nodorum]KAH4446765.1 hypothetical protein HBH90_210210 [Parastagonospora nodorum]